MTMRTILTAAAIISSAGFGASHSPASHPSFDSSVAPFSVASADVPLVHAFASLDQQASPLPPEPWAKADPADSLYRLAREAMSRGDYKRAAEIFHRIPERYPQSAYAGQSLYFEAYSLYRSGGDEDLSTARDRLTLLKQRFPAIAKKDGDPASPRSTLCCRWTRTVRCRFCKRFLLAAIDALWHCAGKRYSWSPRRGLPRPRTFS